MASEIRIDKVSAAGATSNMEIESPGGDLVFSAPNGIVQLNPPPAGMVVQVQTVRSDVREYVAGNDTKLANLAITITPKYASSLLICQWYISGEAHQDVVLRVMKDGVTPSNGYNTESGLVNWSGIVAWEYDQNEDSTPGQRVVNYFDSPGVTVPIEYAPSVRDSSTGSDGIYLNRTFDSTGSNAREATVSFGMIWEIAQ